CRPGAWCPVHVELQAGDAESVRGDYELVVETPDSDDVLSHYVTPLASVGPGEHRRVATCYRPGNRTAGLRVFVRKAGGGTVHSVEKAPDLHDVLRPEDVLYLTLGTRLPALRRGLVPHRPGGQEKDEQAEERAERGIALGTDPDELPAEWIGYEGVDVVVLPTGDAPFLRRLAGSSARVRALGEWVRRGGRLVVGAGRNAREA